MIIFSFRRPPPVWCLTLAEAAPPVCNGPDSHRRKERDYG